ncbi:MAG: serine/threonine protein kinase [Armatimonadetes bacterium]|nr:serine/threonine protein kinase [Armatimonadota bacterium]
MKGALGLCALAVLAMLAEAASADAYGPLHLSLDRPMQVRWRPLGVNGVAGDWRGARSEDGKNYRIDRQGQSIEIRAAARANLLFDWVAVHPEVSFSNDRISLSSRRQLNGFRTGVVISSLSFCGLVALYGLKRKQHKHTIAETLRQADEREQAAYMASLFPTDGSLPQRVGRYQVGRCLGTGGMARVFEVKDPDRNARYAAKVPLPQFGTDPEYRKRFGREALLMAALSQTRHPNVVQLYYWQIPRAQDEYPYLIMELVEGESWEDRLAAVGVTESQALHWAVGALKGLEFMHGKGIIHRDLKPSNIFITPEGDAKLMDLGIARDLYASTVMTRGSEVFGTPAFMAPEQLKQQELTPRVDLYALGLVVYQSLSGRLPFSDELVEILALKLAGSVPPLDRLDLPSQVTDWVMRMVASAPEDRFGSAAEAREELEKVLQLLC